MPVCLSDIPDERFTVHCRVCGRYGDYSMDALKRRHDLGTAAVVLHAVHLVFGVRQDPAIGGNDGQTAFRGFRERLELLRREVGQRENVAFSDKLAAESVHIGRLGDLGGHEIHGKKGDDQNAEDCGDQLEEDFCGHGSARQHLPLIVAEMTRAVLFNQVTA